MIRFAKSLTAATSPAVAFGSVAGFGREDGGVAVDWIGGCGDALDGREGLGWPDVGVGFVMGHRTEPQEKSKLALEFGLTVAIFFYCSWGACQSCSCASLSQRWIYEFHGECF
jgi:hypothetical protein